MLSAADGLSAVIACDLYRRTHLQYTAVNAGMCHINGVPQLLHRQIGRNYHGETSLIAFINDGIDLLQGIFSTSFDTQIINDEKRIMRKGGNVLVAFIAVHASHLIENLREVGNQHRHALLQKCIGNAGDDKGFSCTNRAPKQKAKVFRLDLLPVLYIFPRSLNISGILRHIKVLVQKMLFLNSIGLQPLYPSLKLLSLLALFLFLQPFLLTLTDAGNDCRLSQHIDSALLRSPADGAEKSPFSPIYSFSSGTGGSFCRKRSNMAPIT